MKKAISMLCLFALLPIIISISNVSSALPMSKRALIAEKYDSWTGVLRIWICEGWKSGNGSLTLWLNECISSFEKANPGVYIQPKYVEASAIATIGDNGINPPDLILFPPGLLSEPENLLTISLDAPLRAGLSASGRYEGSIYAAPVAMGTYCWVYNRTSLDEIPANWQDAEGENLLIMQEDEQYRSWSGAVLGLCSGLSQNIKEIPALPDVDIGLPEATATPAPTLIPDETDDDVIECKLPADFARSENAYSAFVSNEVAAIPATQREIRRLELLSENGRGPDWNVAMPGKYMYADQLAMVGIIDWERDDIDDRQKLCTSFLELLLSSDAQKLLSKSRAFPVIVGVQAYNSRNSMSELEVLLGDKILVTASAFDTSWHQLTSALLEKFIAGDITANTALKHMTLQALHN